MKEREREEERIVIRIRQLTKKKIELLNGIKTIPTIGKKASWAIKWMKQTNSFAERLIAFGCMEFFYS